MKSRCFRRTPISSLSRSKNKVAPISYYVLARETQKRVNALKARLPEEALICSVSRSADGSISPFMKAVFGKTLAAVGNIRRASPERGAAARASSFSLEKYALAFQSSFVKAVCAVTEPFYYRGEDDFIPELKKLVSLPVLQDDFIITPYQIYYAKLLGADAVTLFSTVMSESKLSEYISIAKNLGLSAVCEVHSVKSADLAVRAGAEIICADNLNPKTHELNFNTALRIREYVPADIAYMVKNAEETGDYIGRLKKQRTNAVIMSDAFMRARAKSVRLEQLGFTKF